MRRLLGILMLFVGCGADRMRPEQEIAAAVESVGFLDAEEAKNTRFISFATIDDEDKALAAGVVSFVLNSLGDSGYISRPEWVPGAPLVRFHLRQFTASEDAYKNHWQTWEDLAAVEPYYHVRTRVAVETTEKDDKGKPIKKVETKDVTVDAPWIPAELATQLREQTASIGPVLRAEWWVSQVMRPPHYYTLTGVPATEVEFLKFVGVDAIEVRRLNAEHGANVISKVAFGHTRRIQSFTGILGWLWVTKDVFVMGDKTDAIRQPLTKAINPETGQEAELYLDDAGEFIASKANGLHVFALYNAQGERQDAVPLGGPGKSIARDTSEDSPGFDGVIIPGLSCVRCHTENGLRDIDDVQASLPGLAALPDAQALLSFYNPPIVQLRLRQARDQYATALRQATDLNSEQVANGLAKLVRTQLYDLVTPERAAQECGLELKAFLEVAKQTADPYGILLSQGRAIHREAWEPTFSVMMSPMVAVGVDE